MTAREYAKAKQELFELEYQFWMEHRSDYFDYNERKRALIAQMKKKLLTNVDLVLFGAAKWKGSQENLKNAISSTISK
jgi:hypothetical protein